MRVGIVGFRGSGKTTVFNALTGLSVEVGGFSGKDAKNLGTIKVPDERLAKIADKVQPKKLVYAEIAFADLAASPPGEKGFGTQSLADMRSSEALVHVLRGFENPALSEKADYMRDALNFESELAIADLIVVENRLARLAKQNTKSRERDVLTEIMAHLENEKPLRTLDLTDDSWAVVAGYAFLSQKPCMILLNVDEEHAGIDAPDDLAELCKANDIRLMVVSGQVEMEINELEADEGAEYLESLGLDSPAKDRFIREAYDMLDLISFFTFGPDETKAWTIRKGLTAHKAAGKIHSDIERGFIRAELMKWEDVVEYGTESKLREAKKISLEGKDYIPKDGDVLHFRFNV